MAGVSITQYRQATIDSPGRANPALVRYVTWGSWTNTSNDVWKLFQYNADFQQTCKLGYVLLKIAVDRTGARSLLALTLRTAMRANGTATFKAYLYTSEPTPEASGTEQFSAPSGYIKSATVTATSTTKYQEVSFAFSDLNITQSYVYVWIELSHTVTDRGSSYAPWRYSYSYSFNYWDSYDISLQKSDTSFSSTFKGNPSSLTITPTTVNTGGNIAVSIGNAWSTETVRFYYGDTLLGSATISNGSGTVAVPKSWFTTAGVTGSQTMTVQARLDGTSLTKNFTVQAGSNMRPSVGTPTLTLVQGSSASAFPSTYIANISKVKVQATVSAGSNAGISTVRVTWSGGSAAMTYNSNTGKYEATVGPIAGNTTFTVTATDARGMTQQKSVSLTGVVQYSAPVITINESKTYRCDSGGTKTDGGAYVRAQCSVAITTALSGNSLQSLRFYIQEDTSKSYTLTNNTQSSAKQGRAADYYETLVFEAKDKIQTVTRAIRLAPATRNITLKRSSDGTYMGVGILPQSTSKTKAGNKSTIDLPEGGGLFVGGYIWGGLTRFDSTASDGSQFGKNFKAVGSLLYDSKNTECYFSKSSDSGWSNYPVSGAFSGVRKVIWVSSSVYIIMIHEISPTAGRIWICTNGGAWKSLTPS